MNHNEFVKIFEEIPGNYNFVWEHDNHVTLSQKVDIMLSESGDVYIRTYNSGDLSSVICGDSIYYSRDTHTIYVYYQSDFIGRVIL